MVGYDGGDGPARLLRLQNVKPLFICVGQVHHHGRWLLLLMCRISGRRVEEQILVSCTATS